MEFTPNNIADWKDRQLAIDTGYLSFRVYANGWQVRYTPFDKWENNTETIFGADVGSACRFANAKQALRPRTQLAVRACKHGYFLRGGRCRTEVCG